MTTLPSMDDVWTCIYTYIGCIVVNRGMVERTSQSTNREPSRDVDEHYWVFCGVRLRRTWGESCALAWPNAGAGPTASGIFRNEISFTAGSKS